MQNMHARVFTQRAVLSVSVARGFLKMLPVARKSLRKELNGMVMQHSHLPDAHYGFAIGCYATLLHVLYVITAYMVYIIIIYIFIYYIHKQHSIRDIYYIFIYIIYILYIYILYVDLSY